MVARRAAFAQLSSCWGCNQSLIDLHFRLLEVLPSLEIVYWPAVVDFKLESLERLPNASVNVGFVEGSCRTEADLHLLRVMREKCTKLVAWGSCSCFGGVQGIGNQWSLKALIERKFLEADTVVDGRIPTNNVPSFLERVYANSHYVDFDLMLPGCPPSSQNIMDAITSVMTGVPFNIPDKTVCDQCTRVREDKHIRQFKRTFEGTIDPKRCILDQGYLCLGFATVGLCGAQCPNANAPCKGCYGPTPVVKDHGAKIIAALGAIAEMSPDALREAFPDPIGSFYFVDYATSYLSRISEKGRDKKR